MELIIIAALCLIMRGREANLARLFLIIANVSAFLFYGIIDDLYFFMLYCVLSIFCYLFAQKKHYNGAIIYLCFAIAYFSIAVEDLFIEQGIIDSYYYVIMYSLTVLLIMKSGTHIDCYKPCATRRNHRGASL